MSLWKIAWRSIQQRALASSLTALSMALGVALVVAVLTGYTIVRRSFASGNQLPYNMIVGAKGGDLQMVLNTVYLLSQPVENIPYSYYLEFLPQAERPGGGRPGRFAEYVERAVPVCMGDYFQGFRVVGTTPQMFEDPGPAFQIKYEFTQGTNFRAENFFEAVVGSQVALKAGVKLGDMLPISHGAAASKDVHADKFAVVGILAPTGTPVDRGVYVNMEGYLLLEGHVPADVKKDTAEAKPMAPDAQAGPVEPKEHASDSAAAKRTPLPIAKRQVTAILIRTVSLAGLPELTAGELEPLINKGDVAKAVMPIKQITQLFNTFVRPLLIVLLILALTIVIVSGIGILVSIYNSMSERRHEIAVMRALGASRSVVLLVVLLESILLSLGGGLVGWIGGRLLIAAAGPWITSETGIPIAILQSLSIYELILIPGLIVLASLVGFLPAAAAYRTDVAKALTATP